MFRFCRKTLFLTMTMIGLGFLLRNYYLNAVANPVNIAKITVGLTNLRDFSKILNLIKTSSRISPVIKNSFLSKVPENIRSNIETNLNLIVTGMATRENINLNVLSSAVQNNITFKSEAELKNKLTALHNSGFVYLLSSFTTGAELQSWLGGATLTQAFNGDLINLLGYISADHLKNLTDLLSFQDVSQSVFGANAEKSVRGEAVSSKGLSSRANVSTPVSSAAQKTVRSMR